jgi:hypothetical protein
MTVADSCLSSPSSRRPVHFRSDLTTMIFRTEEQKRDPVRSWYRSDRSFFAAGACHILAGAFLETYPNTGFNPQLISPHPGLPGSHVFVSNGEIVFDYHGISKHHDFLSHYFTKIRRFFPRWQGEIIRLKESPISESFCRTYNHRLPSQYLHNPLPRAFSFLAHFPSALIFPKELDGHRPPLQL